MLLPELSHFEKVTLAHPPSRQTSPISPNDSSIIEIKLEKLNSNRLEF
jgi:hypothetical protein